MALVLVQSGVEHGQHRSVGGDKTFFSAPHVAGPDQEFADGAIRCPATSYFNVCGHATLMASLRIN